MTSRNYRKGDQYICDTRCKVVTKIAIFVWEGGGEVRKSPNLRDVIYEWPLGSVSISFEEGSLLCQ